MPTTYAIPNGRTVMDATTYTGDGSQTASFTNQFGFKPDLVWSKIRTGTTQGTGVFDSVRGTTGQSLDTASTSVEGTWNGALSSEYGYVSAFNSNGFSVNDGSVATTGGYVNFSGRTYVAWQWQAGQGTTSSNTAGNITSTVSVNASAGFSVVTYAGSNVNGGSVGHGLGVTPAFFIIKARNSAQSWGVYHQSVSSPNDSYLLLNTTDAKATFSGLWTPSSTTITFPTLTTVTNGPFNYVAYCWAEIVGFSKFGSYTGNGSTDGPFIYTGFRPRWIMIKRTDAAYSWWINDSARDPRNVVGQDLAANLSDAESSDAPVQDFLSNGFKLRTSAYPGFNANGGSYIYAAFAENPFKYANAR